ncbi:hypothetical protein PHISCL_03190 [Aspergillus sclerotialis]|uniref:Uncharacterized protein n=1 Tax=Aspergillus sclerotialis TaxID=2070753 RepID=A0A3A2ZMM8_9EURO|nr:hypothetical protein PHISCL_03190 [Aspergillus sclerotialis]
MPFSFNDIKRDSSGEYYYNDLDIPHFRLDKVATSRGDMAFTPDEIEKWFGISFKSTLPQLRKYMIVPTLHSDPPQGDSWSHITGTIGVYKPVEWIPIIKKNHVWPKSAFETAIEIKTTETSSTKLFGSVSLSLDLSGGGECEGVKAEAKLTAETKVEASVSAEEVKTEHTKGTIGHEALAEVIMGTALKMEKVHEHAVDIRLNHHDVTWPGLDDVEKDIEINDRDLSRVHGLQFRDIQMSGSGSSNYLQVQALPVVNDKKDITQLHLVLSHTTWRPWVPYLKGIEKSVEQETVLSYPAWGVVGSIIPLKEEKKAK